MLFSRFRNGRAAAASALGISLLLGGCGSKLDNAHRAKVQMGMTRAEVEDILGAGEMGDGPATWDVGKVETINTETWSDGNTMFVVTYVDGTVQGIKSGPPAALAGDQQNHMAQRAQAVAPSAPAPQLVQPSGPVQQLAQPSGPAPQLAQPSASAGAAKAANAADVADVKAVGIRYMVALMSGDVATAEAASTGIDPKILEVMVDAIASKRDIDTAVWARFAQQGQESKPITMLSAAELKATLQFVNLQVNGETATAQLVQAVVPGVMRFKYDEGEWKVDLSELSRSQSEKKQQIGVLQARAAAAANREVARELGEGRYASSAAATEAVSAKTQAALAADPEYQKLAGLEGQHPGLVPAGGNAPLGQPRPADGAADVAALQAAVHAYFLAVETGNAAGLKACLFNIDPQLIDVHCAMVASIRDMDELCATQFAASPGPKPAHPKSLDALTAQANQDYEEVSKVPVRVNGDAALLPIARASVLKLKRIDGQWKVDGDALFKDPSPENRRRDMIADQIALKVRAPLMQEIAAGKFKTWAAAEQALRNRVAAALAADPQYQQADKALTDSRDRRIAALKEKIAEHKANDAPARDGDVAAAALGRTAMVGGKGGGEFTQPSPDGGPVFGFRYSFGNWNNHQCLGQFDAIFEPAAAGKLGTDAPNTKTLLARNGYVVGGLIVDYDDVNTFAVRVIFVGFKEGRVDAKNTYTSNWIGIPLRIHQQQLAGTGEKVIGIIGRKGLNTDALGLLLETNIKKTARLGGDGGGPFSVTSPTGAPVVGFRYTFGDWGGRKILSSLEPVFRDAAANPMPPQGFPADDLKLLSGRDGYVVKSLLVDTDNTAAVAVKARFVRLRNGVLDEHDSYQSDWIGIPSGIRQQELAGGPGEVMVGAYGQKGLNLDALGLLVGPLPGPGPASRPSTTQPAR